MYLRKTIDIVDTPSTSFVFEFRVNQSPARQ